jgi:hypothetical protein
MYKTKMRTTTDYINVTTNLPVLEQQQLRQVEIIIDLKIIVVQEEVQIVRIVEIVQVQQVVIK